MRRAKLALVVVCLQAGIVMAATGFQVYRVQDGDSLEAVAAGHGVAVADLLRSNPRLRPDSPLTAGEWLTVPMAGSRAAEALPPVGQRAAGADAAAPLRGSAGPRIVGPEAETGAGEALPQPGGEGMLHAEGAAPTPQQPATPPSEAGSAEENYAVNGAVGRLGLAYQGALLRREPTDRAAVMYRCDEGAKLVLTRRQGGWYSVMMVDGSTGWVIASQVQLTASELVHDQQQLPGTPLGRAIVESALSYLGVPYRWGGNGYSGIDCSGLVQQCFAKHGLKMPRIAREQFRVGQPVAPENLLPGDRVFFSGGGQYPDHVGIYIGNGQFVHASGGRNVVCIDNLFDPRHWRIFVGAKR